MRQEWFALALALALVVFPALPLAQPPVDPADADPAPAADQVDVQPGIPTDVSVADPADVPAVDPTDPDVATIPVADEPTTPGQWYSSLAGIGVATIILVGILKRALARVMVLNQVPLWLYAVAVSAGLIYLTNQIWHTLPGELWPLMMQAVMSAAAASGFYAWLNADSAGIMKSIIKPLGDANITSNIGL